jgi:Nitrate and nitrite sensing
MKSSAAPVIAGPLLLIIIPTLAALIWGGSRIVTSAQSAHAYQRVEQLASMSGDVTGLAARLEDERDQTLEYVGEGTAGRTGMIAHFTGNGAPQNLQIVQEEQSLTSPWVGKVRQDAAGIAAGYPEQVQTDTRNIGKLLKLLPSLRNAATDTQLPPTQVMSQYAAMIDDLLAIDNNIALGSGDQVLNNDVRALNLVSLIAEQASQQRGLLAYAFAQDGVIAPQVLSAVTSARAEENANTAEYSRVATPQQVSQFDSSVSGSLVDYANSYELQALQYGQDGKPLDASATTANEWFGAISTGTIGGIDFVQQKLMATTLSRASALRRQAITTAIGVGAALLIVLLLALLLATIVVRSKGRSKGRSGGEPSGPGPEPRAG